MFSAPEGIRIDSSTDVFSGMRYAFTVACHDLERLARAQVRALDQGVHLLIHDHRQHDAEGWLSLRKAGGQLRRMAGGHGFSSAWKEVSEADAVAEVAATLAATMGGAHLAGGHFETGRFVKM